MDYDRNDALLHWIFRQTQGDAWFRPNEEQISSGVALRISDPHLDCPPEFRVFPYENANLEPFETAVSALNPLVAVKVRTAAVHAALADVASDDKHIYVDADTRIQIIETMLLLPQADKEQCAAFIRDERVLVVWSETIDHIVPACHEIEERLIKLLWRSRPPQSASANTSIAHAAQGNSAAPSIADQSVDGLPLAAGSLRNVRSFTGLSGRASGFNFFGDLNDVEDKEKSDQEKDISKLPQKPEKSGWFGSKKKPKDIEAGNPDQRLIMFYAPLYNGFAAALSFVFIGTGVSTLLQEWALDGIFVRFALCALVPFLYCVSLFFTLQLVQNVSMAIGPVAQFHQNSKYYSAIKPKPNKVVDASLPHITIQMPVYKEGLETVLVPSIESLKRAMQTYARQGGTSAVFVNDDGLRILGAAERDKRIAYYANHNIGWVARPKHDNATNGFKRAGRFKKASNLNYGLALSLKTERHLESLLAARNENSSPNYRLSSSDGHARQYGMQYQHREGDDQGVPGEAPPPPNGSPGSSSGGTGTPNNVVGYDDEDLEEKALGIAIEEMWEETGKRWRPWAANGKATRIGEIILIVDSDTIVPEDCLRDAAREMYECPEVAVIQHESDVMQIAHHYFENGLAYFTRRINKCISMTCANGEVAPFVGHNAFLRWKALQDAAFVDPADGKEKIWSESNVSEDFDMALRLQLKGYIIRWATYSKGGFKEGVSLSADDELNRWQKYAYGCNELLFNPLVQWWRRGPINPQIHRFLWSRAPLHYKISMLAYMFSYYGIACAVVVGVVNYVFLGFQFPVDGFYIHSFEIWLACMVVFWGAGNVGYTLLEYRLGHRGLIAGFLENLLWIPFFFFFFGGLSIPISQAIFAHIISYNITWSATVKEVERSNFFKEIPKILKRFWFSLLISFVLIAGMVICGTRLVPLAWRVDMSAWAVIFPLTIVAACHILYPIVLNPWLMVFSY
ncbi:Glycosyl transferase family group 2 domain containing protein [Amanita muscaria]